MIRERLGLAVILFMIVQVIPAIRLPQGKVFDYLLPEGLPIPKRGSLLRVQFRNRTVTALAVGVSESSETPILRLKTAQSLIAGGQALLNEEVTDLLERLRVHYQTSWPLLLLTFLPPLPAKIELQLVQPPAAGRSWSHRLHQVESCFDQKIIADLILAESQSGPLLVLTSTKNHSDWLAEILRRSAGVAVYDGSLPTSQALSSWSALVTGSAEILIAARSGVLAPLPPGGRLIIFHEEEPSFAQFDARPRYDARLIARARARAESRALTTITEAPTLAAYADADRKELLPEPRSHYTLVNLADERRAGNFSIFSDAAVKTIIGSLQNNKSVLVCANRKDSARLKEKGLTVVKAIRELARLFPGSSIVQISNTDDLTTSPEPAILVGTEILLHSLRPMVERKPIGAIVVPLAEQLLGIGSWSDAEEGLALLAGFEALAKRKEAELLLQTYDPVGQSLLALGLPAEPACQELLLERAKYKYPPSWTVLSLTVPEQTAEKEITEKIKEAVGAEVIIQKTSESSYLIRFPNKEELLPYSFSNLPKGWTWQVNPRTFLKT